MNSQGPLTAKLLADLAVDALIAELDLYPKPGLVSPVDSGSHHDMDFALLRASAICLHGFFEKLALAGAAGASFHSDLIPLGIQAEKHMLQVTGGINTHRGAIFSMGLLVAAAACVGKRRPDAKEVREVILNQWAAGLMVHAASEAPITHEDLGRRISGAGGAREEAAAGFPSIFEHALPCYQDLIQSSASLQEAGVETLFLLMSIVPDTNILHRGGEKGAAFLRKRAEDFLESGGIKSPSWEKLAITIHREFVSRNLSPGGCADLLAGTIFLQKFTALRGWMPYRSSGHCFSGCHF